MERMLVAIFDSEDKAYAGSRALHELKKGGVIGISGARVVMRHDDGATSVTKIEGALPQATLGATAVGSLAGMPGGPVAVALGTVAGAVVGAATDLRRDRLVRSFIAAVAGTLAPGKAAVVAELDEESVGLVGERMVALGGSVFSRNFLKEEKLHVR